MKKMPLGISFLFILLGILVIIAFYLVVIEPIIQTIQQQAPQGVFNQNH